VGRGPSVVRPANNDVGRLPAVESRRWRLGQSMPSRTVLKFGPPAEKLRPARPAPGKFDKYQEGAKPETQLARLYPDLFPNG
jgi:hypothetical protein